MAAEDVARSAGMFNPISAGIGLAGGIIGGLIQYYGIKQQIAESKRTREAQQSMFEEQRGDQNAQFTQQFGEGQRQFNAASQMQQQQLGQQGQLQNRSLDIQEKGQNAAIAESQATRAQALQQKKLDDNLALFNHITTFLNTPGARSQFASLWAGGK